MPLVVTQSGYNSARADFQSHYFLSDCDTDFGGQDLQIEWEAFAGPIEGFISKNKVDPSNVALRFVYCYDDTNRNLYLRMQICTMTKRTNSNVYDLNATPTEWYIITQEAGIESTSNNELSDDAYLNNFYYCDKEECSSNTLVKLADDDYALFARNLVFPWGLQISQLYPDNNSPAGAKVCFGASSFLNTGAGASFQHTLVIYLRDSNGAELLNDYVGSSTYDNKGCDMGTQCPPCCNIYIS